MGSDPVSMRFTTTPFYNIRQFYYALEAGLVESDDVAVTVEHAHSPTKDRRLICGDVDAATMSMGKYVLASMIAGSELLPTRPVAVAAGLTYRQGNGLFVRAGGDVEEPADLRGRRVGIHDASLAMTYHKAALEEGFGVGPDDVEWVVAGHDRLTELLDVGEVAAIERINDWYWECMADERYRFLYDVAREWHDVHGYYPLIHLVAVDADRRRTRPEAVDAFVDLLRRSRAYREENYDDVLAAFVDGEVEGEWTGERSTEALRRITDGVDCPFTLEPSHRRNVLDWMRYADRYGVVESFPVPEERLFPDAA